MTVLEKRGSKRHSQDFGTCPLGEGSTALEAGCGDQVSTSPAEHPARRVRGELTAGPAKGSEVVHVPQGGGDRRPVASGQRCRSRGDSLGGRLPTPVPALAFHGPEATRNRMEGSLGFKMSRVTWLPKLVNKTWLDLGREKVI